MIGWLGTLVALPVAGPLRGLGWIAGGIAETAAREALNPARIQAALRTLEEALEAGRITEDAFEAEEAALLARLAEIRARQGLA